LKRTSDSGIRLKSPAGVMLVVAVIGLAVNVAGLFILRQGAESSLNLKGAYFEVLSDMLSSLGVIAAAVIIWRTGWVYVDPLVSAGIGLFILPRTWNLIREAVGILLEGTPSDINLAAVRDTLLALPGVEDVHDLHIWTLTSGLRALSAHSVVTDTRFTDSLLANARKVLQDRFNIAHVTMQLETRPCEGGQRHA
jgi:cobalt-zinc-cadmium efflux system protein